VTVTEEGHKPGKILLIEDDPEYAYLMQQMLTIAWKAPPDVEHADSLSTGLERLVEADIDMILLDLSLPDSWGFETFARVHAQAPQVPIIVLSGLDDEGLAAEIVQKGAQDYLVKGQTNASRLARAMRHAIDHKQTEEALSREVAAVSLLCQ
jgi:two-component system cell cycle sensor histidine kinase/response regulator CckA